MNLQKINSRKEYNDVMLKIESYIQKATFFGGFSYLQKNEVEELERLSLIIEEYEKS
jgi:hypothetical protein